MERDGEMVVFVTGAGSGIGRAVASGFARAGATLALVGRRAAELEETAMLVRRNGATALVLPADVTDEPAVSAMVAQLGRIDVAVNAAGVLSGGTLETMAKAEFERVMMVNVVGTWVAMKHEIAAMKNSGGGAIINIGSNVGARLVRPTLGAYAASKAAVSSLTRTAALEAISHGIRINCLCPGPVDTPMSLRQGEDRTARDRRIATTNPSGRVATTAEIAAAAVWLASEAAAYVVGQDLVIDGGASI